MPGIAGLLEVPLTALRYPASDDETDDDEHEPGPEAAVGEDPAEREALVRHLEPIDADVLPGEARQAHGERRPEEDLDQERDVPDRLDVDGGELVDDPVAREAGDADDRPEDGGDDDAGDGDTQRVDDPDDEGARTAVRRGVDALPDLDTGRIGQPLPAERDVGLLEVVGSPGPEGHEEGDHTGEDDELGRPLEHGGVAPQRCLLVFSDLDGHTPSPVAVDPSADRPLRHHRRFVPPPAGKSGPRCCAHPHGPDRTGIGCAPSKRRVGRPGAPHSLVSCVGLSGQRAGGA